MKTTLFFIMGLLGSMSFLQICNGQIPPLGTTSTFAVFTAAGAINNIGPTTVIADLGTNVGAYNGFPPGIVLGVVHNEDPVSILAAIDVQIAYGFFTTIPCDSTIGTTLGNGQILTPNVYCLGGASSLEGNLTLDAEGNPNAIFIFKINGAFATEVLTNIILVNSASICNIYWQVNGQFTLGDNSIFFGTVINDGAIIILDNAYMEGRLLSVAGAVNLNTNVIDNVCSNALPIDLVSFSADCKNHKAYLEWTTAKEVNNNYFSIERSSDAESWEKIGEVDGGGNSSRISQYLFIDENPNTQINYYRFEQVDFDGKSNFSNTINIGNCSKVKSEIEIFSNIIDGTLNINYNDESDKFISASIYNSLGELIYHSNHQESTINLTHKIIGIYFMHINMASGLIVKKIL